jgi:hypothetical protein
LLQKGQPMARPNQLCTMLGTVLSAVCMISVSTEALAVCEQEIADACRARTGAVGTVQDCIQYLQTQFGFNDKDNALLAVTSQAPGFTGATGQALIQCASSIGQQAPPKTKNTCDSRPSFVFRPVYDQNTNICTFNVDNNSPYQISCKIAYPNGGSRLLPVSAGQSNFEGWPLGDLGGQCSATVTCKRAANVKCKRPAMSEEEKKSKAMLKKLVGK